MVAVLDEQEHYFRNQAERDGFYERMGVIAQTTDDAYSYYGAVSRALASLDEGHTGLIASREVPFGETIPPVAILEVDGYPVIAGTAQGIEAGGLLPGDVILKVDGVAAGKVLGDRVRSTPGSTDHGRRARALANLLAGPTNSPARVRVRGFDGRERVGFPLRFLMEDGDPERFRFGFAEDRVRTERISLAVGYIALPDFRAERVAEFERAIEALGEMPVLVLDLRGNPGGRIQTMQEIAGAFLDEPVVLLQVRDGTREDVVRASPRKVRSRAKLRIVIDERTGSAAELLAAALQDLGRAEVIGRPSAGSTRSRRTMLLPGEVLFHYAGRAEFVRSNGLAIEGVGVKPGLFAHPTRKSLAAGSYGDPNSDPAILLAAGLD